MHKRTLILSAAIAVISLGAAGFPGMQNAQADDNHGRAQSRHNSDQQPNIRGKSLSQLMSLYWQWVFGGGDDGTGKITFLPLPAGELTSGSGTVDDPAVLEGSLTVSLGKGKSFFLPILAWVGERYLDGSEDQFLDKSVFNASEILVRLDGRTIVAKRAGTRPCENYVDPQVFPFPLEYELPTDYGSDAALWVQGFGFEAGPLSVGTHTLTLHATALLEDLDLGLEYNNTWTIKVAR
jgi:hypothetical protein